jgi:hypothetical protein
MIYHFLLCDLDPHRTLPAGALIQINAPRLPRVCRLRAKHTERTLFVRSRRDHNMKSRFLSSALAAGAVMLLGLPAIGQTQDSQITAPLTSLPKKGTVTYTGIFALDGYSITGPIQVYVDFASHAVSADLTIPPLGGLETLTVPYSPTGLLTSSNKHATYTLTQGVSNSQDEPYILLTGSFSGAHAQETLGSFIANFCYQFCDTGLYILGYDDDASSPKLDF